MHKIAPLALTSLIALSGCNAVVPQGIPTLDKAPGGVPAIQTSFSVAPANAPSGPQVDQFARSFLNSIQPRSIREAREYCGYFYLDEAGRMQATPAEPGTFASCSMPAPQPGQGIFASYHTHSAYRTGYDNEVPSSLDLESDFAFGIDGYVSTPGGRVWLVDYQTGSTSQVCGLGCVYSDPGFQPEGEETIRQRFTLADLYRR